MNNKFKKCLQSTFYVSAIATTLCAPLAVKAGQTHLNFKGAGAPAAHSAPPVRSPESGRL